MTVSYVDGSVYVFRKAYNEFPRYAIAQAGYENSDRDGYFVIGGFVVGNHNGAVLAPSLFLRRISRNRDKKTVKQWAIDIKHWVRFFEATKCRGLQPPYRVELFHAAEEDLLRYTLYLQRSALNHHGEPLANLCPLTRFQRSQGGASCVLQVSLDHPSTYHPRWYSSCLLCDF